MSEVRMIDVGGKPITRRRARAGARVRLAPAVIAHIRAGTLPKGDVLGVARIAAITGSKRTPDLLPLCHPLALTHVAASLELDDEGVSIEVVCETTGQTGVEMEAMTACAVAALCVYDMTKGIDATGQIESVVLLEKEGGKSGHWVRP
jgi:cyclic pyranopterin monophosphate synthase